MLKLKIMIVKCQMVFYILACLICSGIYYIVLNWVVKLYDYSDNFHRVLTIKHDNILEEKYGKIVY